jgi:hypothetical protein
MLGQLEKRGDCNCKRIKTGWVLRGNHGKAVAVQRIEVNDDHANQNHAPVYHGRLLLDCWFLRFGA